MSQMSNLANTTSQDAKRCWPRTTSVPSTQDTHGRREKSPRAASKHTTSELPVSCWEEWQMHQTGVLRIVPRATTDAIGRRVRGTRHAPKQYAAYIETAIHFFFLSYHTEY